MKKVILVGLLFILMINIGGRTTSSILIPEDAIRYRIIANSDSTLDQTTKLAVRNALEKVMNPIMLTSTTKEEVRNKLTSSRDLLHHTVAQTLQSLKQDETYQIQYGMNYFPEKEYQGVTYQPGEYESLIVTLGKGEGANFWCVLFPPLCLLEGEKTDSEKVEYTSFIQEIIHSIFHF